MEMVCDDVLRRDFVGGLVTYFIYTTLLIGLYVVGMSYMAAQRSAPLRSRRHTMMGGFINNKYIKKEPVL